MPSGLKEWGHKSELSPWNLEVDLARWTVGSICKGFTLKSSREIIVRAARQNLSQWGLLLRRLAPKFAGSGASIMLHFFGMMSRACYNHFNYCSRDNYRDSRVDDADSGGGDRAGLWLLPRHLRVRQDPVPALAGGRVPRVIWRMQVPFCERHILFPFRCCHPPHCVLPRGKN